MNTQREDEPSSLYEPYEPREEDEAEQVVQVMATEETRRQRLLLYSCIGACVVAVSAVVAALGANGASGAASTVPMAAASSALATQGGMQAEASQWALAFRDATQGLLDRATSRGDQAVLAATRCTATLEQARHRIAQLEERLQETRTALTATQAALRDRDEALRAKEEALARLEDLHSSHSQQLDKEAACCQSSLQARGRLEERTRRCELQLGRMEQQLEQARAIQQAAAAAAAARATQQQLERAARAAAGAVHRQHVNTWAWGRSYE